MQDWVIKQLQRSIEDLWKARSKADTDQLIRLHAERVKALWVLSRVDKGIVRVNSGGTRKATAATPATVVEGGGNELKRLRIVS